jgi:hypothetical protein
MKKMIGGLLMVGLLAIAVFVGGYLYQTYAHVWFQRTESQSAVVIRVQELEFLVTQKIIAQYTDNISEYSVLAGEREGILIGIINIYYGIDLKKVTEESIKHEAGKTVVELPEPEILDISVAPGSIKFFSRRSGLVALIDMLSNRNDEALLRDRFTKTAREFYSQKGFLPTKEDVLNNLRRAARVFSPKDHEQMEFRYKANKPKETAPG